MGSILVVAGKEFRDGLRNKWVAGATLLLAALAFALTFLGSTPTGLLDVKPLAVTVVSISSLTIFLIPLIALLIGYDAIVGEAERGSLLLLLTYPVSRFEILFGKFLGHAAILAIRDTHRLWRRRCRRGMERQCGCRKYQGVLGATCEFSAIGASILWR